MNSSNQLGRTKGHARYLRDLPEIAPFPTNALHNEYRAGGNSDRWHGLEPIRLRGENTQQNTTSLQSEKWAFG